MVFGKNQKICIQKQQKFNNQKWDQKKNWKSFKTETVVPLLLTNPKAVCFADPTTPPTEPVFFEFVPMKSIFFFFQNFKKTEF